MGINTYKKFKRDDQSGAKKYRRPLVFSGTNFKSKPEKTKYPIVSFWKLIVLLIFILTLLYIIFYSKYFRIKEIIIQGNVLTSEENISQHIPNNSNIFLFNSSKTKKLILQNNPEIKNIDIIRGIPNALKIVILEHDNKIIWESGGNRYLVSSQGKVTKKINQEDVFAYPSVIDNKNVPVEISANIVSSSFISFIININSKLFESTNLSPLYFQVNETTFDLNLYTDSGIYIKFNTMRSSAKQLDNLKKVLIAKKSEIKEYVDLRIDGLAYFK